jgi:transcriptional regulator with XRE-family HTH domain
MSESRDELKKEFQDKEYREAYAEDLLNTSIATQLVVLREQRRLTQEQLAQKIGTRQAGISRIENVNYSAWNIRTLKKIAFALDVRLKVSFETFGSLLDEAVAFSREFLQRPPFEKDLAFQSPNSEEGQSEQEAATSILVQPSPIGYAVTPEELKHIYATIPLAFYATSAGLPKAKSSLLIASRRPETINQSDQPPFQKKNSLTTSGVNIGSSRFLLLEVVPAYGAKPLMTGTVAPPPDDIDRRIKEIAA